MGNFKDEGEIGRSHLSPSIKNKVFNSIEDLEKINQHLQKPKDRLIECISIPFPNQEMQVDVSVSSLRQLLKNEQYFKPHKANYYAILFFDAGKGIYSVGGDELIIKEKYLLLIPPHVTTHFYEDMQYEGTVLFFEETFFTENTVKTHLLYDGMLFDKGKATYLPVRNREKSVGLILDYIAEELKENMTPVQKIIIANGLYNLMLIASELISDKNIPYRKNSRLYLVNQFKKLVYQEKNKNQPVKYYVDLLSVNGLSLENAFKEHEHTTPKQWLIQIIILEIKQELRYSNQSISEIAFHSGFSDTSNFTKFFKKHCGITPTEFRDDPLKHIF